MENGVQSGALYIRVSTDRQDELSPDAQKRLLLDYARSNRIIISGDHVFLDSGISGKKADKRPEFQRMIALAKSPDKPIQTILVWKFSRFARNQEESIVYKSMLKKDGVDVISISEPLVDGPFGTLIERIIEWMDEYYSIRLSGEVFRGMSEAALRGKYLARPPLGYRIDRPKEPPVIVEEEAKTVRLIFDMYVNQNLSIFEITRRLNSFKLKTSRNGDFEKRSIEYIINNPTYIGKIRWNRTENETNRIKDKSEWIIEDGHFQPIITQELFEAAVQKFESSNHKKKSRPVETYRHWLSGMFKCSACGRTLTTSIHKDNKSGRQYINFQCYGYNKGKCIESHSLSEKKAVSAIIASFHDLLSSEVLQYKKIESVPVDGSMVLLREQLSKIEQKEQRIKQAYRDGIDTLAEYKENKQILKEEHERLSALIHHSVKILSTRQSDTLMRSRLRNVCDIISSDCGKNEKAAAIHSICEQIVFDKKNDEFHLYLYLSNP